MTKYSFVKQYRRQSLIDISATFNSQKQDPGVSKQTVRRRLREDHYQRCVVAKKTTRSKVNHVARVRSCKEHLNDYCRQLV